MEEVNKAKAIINSCDKIVDESLEGLVLMRPDLVFAGPKKYRIISRAKVDPKKVALVCGGGAGHEPAHAGFVGDGLLTAAVTGGIFSSPNIKAITAAIMHACPGEAGVLVIVKNSTGDRISFAPAVEKARQLGKRVEIIHVSDDIAVEGGRCIGKRGLAGAVLVYKCAGALAEKGAPFDVVVHAARHVAENVHTIGASLTVCEIPGRVPSDRELSFACLLTLFRLSPLFLRPLQVFPLFLAKCTPISHPLSSYFLRS